MIVAIVYCLRRTKRRRTADIGISLYVADGPQPELLGIWRGDALCWAAEVIKALADLGLIQVRVKPGAKRFWRQVKTLKEFSV